MRDRTSLRVTKKPIRFLLSAIAWCFAAQVAVRAQEQEGLVSAELVTLPTPKVLGPFQMASLLEAVAGTSEPAVVRVDRNSDFIKLLKSRYGDAAPQMWPLIKKANASSPQMSAVLAFSKMPPTLPLDEPVQDVVLPAGPTWDLKDSVVKTSVGDSVESIAIRYMGATDNASVARAAKLVRNSNPTLNFATISPGTEVVLPERSYAKVLNAVGIESLKDLGGVRTDPVPVATQSEPSAADCDVPIGGWGFDSNSIVQTLKFNEARMKALGIGGEIVPVAVLDTGVLKEESKRNRIKFWEGDAGAIGFDVSRAAQGYTVEPWVDFLDPKLRDHGTHVAGIVQGSSLSDPMRTVVQANTRIMVLKVLARQVSGNSESASWGIDSVDMAVDLADDAGAKIINMSLDPIESHNDWNFHQGHRSNVYIVAAGNGRRNPTGNIAPIILSDYGARMYPASLGGGDTPNVVSVAAYGAGGLTKFSNFGDTMVTLAAPGCAIESLSADPSKPIRYSGTSQATALVSLTAALLRHYGLDNALSIKQRLIASVDLDEVFSRRVFSAGRLNIEKALNIFVDLAEVRVDGKPVRLIGVVTSNEADPNNGKYRITLDQESGPPLSIPLAEVAKISPVRNKSPGVVRVVRVNGKPGPIRSFFSIETGKLTSQLTFRTESGDVKTLDLANTDDIVLADPKFGNRVRPQ